ncbi:MAG: mannosyltransferase, partial [Deltaproteobacteria bacterium]
MKRVISIPIKFLQTLQNKCHLFYFIRFAGSLIKKNTRLKLIIINLLNRFPLLRNKIYHLKWHSENFNKSSYIVKHTQNYIRNLKYKNISFKKNFDELILIGEINGYHSLPSINRNIIFNLLGKIGKISMIVYHHRYFDKLEKNALLEDEYNRLNSITIDKDISPNNNRVALYHHDPVISDVKEIYGDPIAMFFWEESRIPKEFITTLHTKYKGIIVASYFVKNVLINNGCVAPIKVAAIPIKEPVHSKRYKKENKDRINLLHLSSCLPIKGVDILLKAFNAACKIIDFDMRLTIKTFANPYDGHGPIWSVNDQTQPTTNNESNLVNYRNFHINNISELVDNLVNDAFKDKIKIIFDEDLTVEDMARLYEECDMIVLPTRGGNMNLPAIEAAYLKKPLIVTNFGAQCEFLGSPVRFLDYKFTKASTHFDPSYSIWAEPSEDSLLESILTLSEKILLHNKKLLKELEEQKESIK